MLGKWHLCAADEMNMASTKRNWPVGRGFERYYGFLGGETNQWYPDLVYDNHSGRPADGARGGLPPDDRPRPTRRSSSSRTRRSIAPEKPFFMYFCPGAAHAPHHAPKEWIDKYKGRFDMGYEALPRARVRAPEAAGDHARRRRAVAAQPVRGGDEPRRQAVDAARHGAAVGLAVRRRADAVPPDGRGLRRLPLPRRPRDRAAARLPGGDRPARQHDRRARLRQRRVAARAARTARSTRTSSSTASPTRSRRTCKYLDELGGRRGPTTTTRPAGRGRSTRPFKMWKRYNFEGGIADPLIVSWPKGIKAQRRAAAPVLPRHRHRADDLRLPRRRAAGRGQGLHADPARGRELPLDVRGRRRADAEGDRRSSRCSARARSGTRAGRRSTRPPGGAAAGATSHEERWELYDTDERPAPRCTTCAEQHPEKVQELIDLWFHEAGRYHGPAARRPDRGRDPRRPSGRSSPRRATATSTTRAAPRCPSRRPSTSATAPTRSPPRSRSTTPDAGGVLFSHGSRFGGHALYVKDGKLKYVYNFVGDHRADGRVSDAGARPARSILSASFEREGDGMPTHRHAVAVHRRREGRRGQTITTQPGKFSLVGEGLNVGRDRRRAGHRRLPGRAALGVRRRHDQARSIVDVSGEPFVDLEKEAVGAFMRD